MDETPARAAAAGPAEASGEGAALLAEETIPERGAAAFAAEFFGTLTLVFFITMVVSLFVTPPVSQGAGLPPQQPFIDWAVIGLVHVFALFLLIQTLAVICGAHFNPAITVALGVIRQIRWIDAGIYIAMQLLGGIAGAALTRLIVSSHGKGVFWGSPDISQNFLNGGLVRGMLVEGIGTFFLVWAVVGVAVSPRALKDWAALVIGGTLGLIVMIGGPLTGGGFNPARSIGPAIISGHFDGNFGRFLLAYIVAPLIGGAIGAVVYMVLFLTPGKKGPFGMRPVG